MALYDLGTTMTLYDLGSPVTLEYWPWPWSWRSWCPPPSWRRPATVPVHPPSAPAHCVCPSPAPTTTQQTVLILRGANIPLNLTVRQYWALSWTLLGGKSKRPSKSRLEDPVLTGTVAMSYHKFMITSSADSAQSELSSTTERVTIVCCPALCANEGSDMGLKITWGNNFKLSVWKYFLQNTALLVSSLCKKKSFS
jgi:hypothetical protein